MMKLGKISPFAYSRMKQRGISLDALSHLLAHGRVERHLDGARVVSMECDAPELTRRGLPGRTFYAVVDAAGEVLTVEKRVRLRG